MQIPLINAHVDFQALHVYEFIYITALTYILLQVFSIQAVLLLLLVQLLFQLSQFKCENVVTANP